MAGNAGRRRRCDGSSLAGRGGRAASASCVRRLGAGLRARALEESVGQGRGLGGVAQAQAR